MKISKLLLAAVSATVLLGALNSGASARNLSYSSQTFRQTFREVRLEEGFGVITCQVTLEGSLHGRSMAKTAGSLIGFIRSAILGPCTGGTATIDRETLPWHYRYSSFQGFLPNITSIVDFIIGLSWQQRELFFGMVCHILTTAAEPEHLTFHRNTTTHALTEVGLSGRIRPTRCSATSFTINTASVAINSPVSVSLI